MSNMPCPDCKDGYYYPLVGPREPCQSCPASIKPGLDLKTYIQNVCNRTVHLLAGSIQTKTTGSLWETCCVDIRIDHKVDAPQLAHQFVQGLVDFIHNQGYRNAKIAFDPQIYDLPDDTDTRKHVFSSNKGVVITMSICQRTSNEMQIQAQMRIST